jgi:hypothetical protein
VSTERIQILHQTGLELRPLEPPVSSGARIAQPVAKGYWRNGVLVPVRAKLSSSHFAQKGSGAYLASYPEAKWGS